MGRDELIQYLIRVANQQGLEGKRVIGWIPAKEADQDWRGTFIIAGDRTYNATQKYP